MTYREVYLGSQFQRAMNPAWWGGLAAQRKKQAWKKEQGAHILNLKQETKKELKVCGALKARLQ